mmetsp:Transcript_98324/g.316986  ORF Transcript_98324/g.316986 Transcript_98324/m.316986 type:complete len:195 (-) Transcript_98324:8-592(-)
MLQAARRRLGPERSQGVTFLQGDLCEVQLPAGGCDAVLACAVLHHLPGRRSRDALAHLAHALRPGGRLLASCWDPQAKAVTKRGRPAEGAEPGGYWVAWRCADGQDVDRWYHLPPLQERLALWHALPGLELLRAELLGDNQVFEWRKTGEAPSSPSPGEKPEGQCTEAGGRPTGPGAVAGAEPWSIDASVEKGA